MNGAFEVQDNLLTDLTPIYVESRAGDQREILSGVDYSSVDIDRSVTDTQNQYTLTVYQLADDKYSYQLCQNKNYIIINGQKYTINIVEETHNNGIPNRQLTVTHWLFDVENIRYDSIANADETTYSISQLLSYFNFATMGVEVRVIGNFDSIQIQNFGKLGAWNMIKTYIIGEMFGIVDFDGNVIYVYSETEFEKAVSGNLVYYGDTDSIQLQLDSTSIVNKCHILGKPTDDTNTSYYVDQEYSNQDSIDKYGVWYGDEQSNENYSIAADFIAYLDKTLQLAPTLQLTTSQYSLEYGLGDTLNLIDKDDESLNGKIICYGYSGNIYLKQAITYSWNSSPVSLLKAQLTLINQTQKQTNQDNANLLSQLNSVAVTAQNATTTAGNAATVSSDNSNEIAALKETIAELQQQINNGGSGTTWTSGSIFVDVSSNNSNTAQSWFTTLKTDGVTGLMIKLTEGSASGTDYVNSVFNTQKTNAVAAGLTFMGAYHFFHGQSTSDAKAEADFFISNLQSKGIAKTALVALDVEASDLSTDMAALTSYVKAFWAEMTAAGYTNQIDYASASWLSSRFTSSAGKKWIASWGASSVPSGADAWQYTDNFNSLSVDASKSYNQNVL